VRTCHVISKPHIFLKPNKYTFERRIVLNLKKKKMVLYTVIKYSIAQSIYFLTLKLLILLFLSLTKSLLLNVHYIIYIITNILFFIFICLNKISCQLCLFRLLWNSKLINNNNRKVCIEIFILQQVCMGINLHKWK
jgi:hypothetical protein